MRGKISLAWLTVTLVSFCAGAEEAASVLEDENARLNYGVGYQVGGDFRRQGIDLDPEIMIEGVEDALNGNAPRMTPAEMRKTLADLQRQTAAKRKARAEELTAERRKAGEKWLAANRDKPGVQVTASGLQYKVIREGEGPRPGPKDKVRVNYRGTRIDGSEFDSSYKRGKPAEFQLDRVIKGWTEGLQLMQEGAKYELYVPAGLAYGGQGRLAHQTLIFEVELLAVVGAGQAAKAE